MATINSDLLHVLENVFGDHQEIKLSTPIKFKFNSKLLVSGIQRTEQQIHEIKTVCKKGRSWKMFDEWDNEWTISNLDNLWQSNLYYNLLSMRDKRVSPANYDLQLL